MTVGRIPSVEGGIQPTLLTTKGDIIVATGNATLVRQGVGTNGQVLTADSTQADGVIWATPSAGGAYTSLASGSITNGLSLTSISGSYTDLLLVLTNFAPTVTDIIGVRINNDATTANYVGAITRNITGGTGASVQANSWAFVDVNSNSSVRQTTTGNSAFVYFSNYANTTGYKIVTAAGGANNNLSTYTSGYNAVTYLSTSAITRLDLKTAGSDWANQGTYTLYGVK
jgi:trimeric autotransporter adhesin